MRSAIGSSPSEAEIGRSLLQFASDRPDLCAPHRRQNDTILVGERQFDPGVGRNPRKVTLEARRNWQRRDRRQLVGSPHTVIGFGCQSALELFVTSFGSPLRTQKLTCECPDDYIQQRGLARSVEPLKEGHVDSRLEGERSRRLVEWPVGVQPGEPKRFDLYKLQMPGRASGGTTRRLSQDRGIDESGVDGCFGVGSGHRRLSRDLALAVPVQHRSRWLAGERKWTVVRADADGTTTHEVVAERRDRM